MNTIRKKSSCIAKVFDLSSVAYFCSILAVFIPAYHCGVSRVLILSNLGV